MVVFLLLIIACCLLFGSQATKDGCLSIFIAIFMLAMFAWVLGSCGMI